MKYTMKKMVKKLINLKSKYGVEDAPYFVEHGVIPYFDSLAAGGHLIGMSEQIWNTDEDGEDLFSGYETVLFTKLERQMLRRAGF